MNYCRCNISHIFSLGDWDFLIPVIVMHIYTNITLSQMPPPKLDKFGRLVEDQPQDDWQARSGVATALKALSALIPSDQITDLFSFYVPQALGDRIPAVRSQMRDAALAAINVHKKVKGYKVISQPFYVYSFQIYGKMGLLST